MKRPFNLDQHVVELSELNCFLPSFRCIFPLVTNWNIYLKTRFFVPGVEACGVVTAVGPGLTGRKVGDVVAFAGGAMGSYVEELILPADKVVPVPPSIEPTVAASILLKGMTAQFLLRRCFKVLLHPPHLEF